MIWSSWRKYTLTVFVQPTSMDPSRKTKLTPKWVRAMWTSWTHKRRRELQGQRKITNLTPWIGKSMLQVCWTFHSVVYQTKASLASTRSIIWRWKADVYRGVDTQMQDNTFKEMLLPSLTCHRLFMTLWRLSLDLMVQCIKSSGLPGNHGLSSHLMPEVRTALKLWWP